MAEQDRPKPPPSMFGFGGKEFVVAHELEEWARETFIDAGASLVNEDHIHLRDARIGFLWTTVPNARHQNQIAGQAERPMFQGGRWIRRRQEQQMEEWFGALPDFVITIDAGYAASVDDASFCALIEHELYHCGQERGNFGEPKFSQATGLPVFALRGHDVEEFVGVVRRYGVGAGAGQTLALVEAAQRGPEIAKARITAACGNCRTLVG